VVKSLNVVSTSIVTDITGVHLEGKSNNDVQMFAILNQNCPVLPQGIEKFFPNIRTIFVQNSKLTKISSPDLQPFSNLHDLMLSDNLIENLPSNLFETNPSIQFVRIDNNKMAKVGANIFDPLINLSLVSFEGNVCINQAAVGSEAITALKETLSLNCA
jgi:Leucine-rich repeat (LRR) protein